MNPCHCPVIKDGGISIHQTLKQVQGDTEFAYFLMLNLVQQLVTKDYDSLDNSSQND